MATPGEVNPYTYSNCNPTNYTDPSGLSVSCIAGELNPIPFFGGDASLIWAAAAALASTGGQALSASVAAGIVGGVVVGGLVAAAGVAVFGYAIYTAVQDCT